MKKLRPQVSADLVEQVKGEFKSFEEGLHDLLLVNKMNELELKLNEKTISYWEQKYKQVVKKHGDLSDRYRSLHEKYCDYSDENAKLKHKLKGWDELRGKYNREVHQREMLELKYKQLECDAKVKDAAEFSDKIAALLDLDKDMLGKSQSITVRVEAGQILVDLDGCMPLVKFTN